jgi:hypothetical protein
MMRLGDKRGDLIVPGRIVMSKSEREAWSHPGHAAVKLADMLACG